MSWPGRVRLKERQLRVTWPRLREKGRGANKEVPLPAYEAMQQEEEAMQQEER